MRIISKGTIERYGAKHNLALEPLRAWHALVKSQEWEKPADVRVSFPSASFVGKDRIIFNIKGNSYRLVTRVVYKNPKKKHGVVYVVKAMTHAEYDKIDVTTLRYEG